MTVLFRNYKFTEDYQRVDNFLIRHYLPGNQDGNWLEPVWEYMHSHPSLDRSSLGKIGVWEEGREMVAVAHYESRLGEAFFEFHPDFRYLRAEMLSHAENNLYATTDDGARLLHIYINDSDIAFKELARQNGYSRLETEDRPLFGFAVPSPFPIITLPEGYHLKSLADDKDWIKVHRVLWRGFNHSGEPIIDPKSLEERRRMFETPKARLDLKVMVETPDHNYASFCGMFYEPNHKYALVEPVATDPDYRLMGMGKAAVLEGVRRCGLLGATLVYVGSDQLFYQAIGFEQVNTSECWCKQIQ